MIIIVFLLVCLFGLICSCDDRSGALLDELSLAGDTNRLYCPVDGERVCFVAYYRALGYQVRCVRE